jgi:hypothetical protein
MKQVIDFWENNLSILMFCIALSFYLLTYKELNSMITIVKSNLNKQETVYEQELGKIDNETVSYAELIATLIGDIEINIRINELIIDEGSYNYKQMNFTQIPQKEYVRNYMFDDAGNVTQIVYTSK